MLIIFLGRLIGCQAFSGLDLARGQRTKTFPGAVTLGNPEATMRSYIKNLFGALAFVATICAAFTLLFVLQVPGLETLIVILPVFFCSLFSWFAISGARVRSAIATLVAESFADVFGTLICPTGFLIASLVGQRNHA